MTHRGEHSSRRQQQRRPNTENSSDIEGTAHRVASVTLNTTESDSRTSADVPIYSLRSKRRKKLPRREKQQIGSADMEVDEHQTTPWKELSLSTTGNESIPTCKVQMDWEHGEGSSAINSTQLMRPPALDMENSNQSDQFSHSDSEASTSNIDADDEQSDWPGNELVRPAPHLLSSTTGGPFQLAPPQPAHVPLVSQKDAVLSAEVKERIERFLQNADDRELLLDKVYRTSAVKQMLRRQFVDANVQIVKRGRGTVALKKL